MCGPYIATIPSITSYVKLPFHLWTIKAIDSVTSVLPPIMVKDEQTVILCATLCSLQGLPITGAFIKFNELVDMFASELEE